MIIVVNVGLLRWDAYGRYKQELDCLYALGEPQLEGGQVADKVAGHPGGTRWIVTVPMHALYLLSPISLNWNFCRRPPEPRVSGFRSCRYFTHLHILDYART